MITRTAELVKEIEGFGDLEPKVYKATSSELGALSTHFYLEFMYDGDECYSVIEPTPESETAINYQPIIEALDKLKKYRDKGDSWQVAFEKISK